MTNQNQTIIQTPRDEKEQWTHAYIATYKTLDDAKKPFHLLLERITHLQETSNSIQVWRANDALGQPPLVFEPSDLLESKPYRPVATPLVFEPDDLLDLKPY